MASTEVPANPRSRTHSSDPYPARGDLDKRSSKFAGGGDHEPRDRLTVIEGIDVNGRPKKITHFVDKLNIPIGQIPLDAGESAIVYSIPNIYHIVDSDGDGVADSRKVIYRRFGNADTHGMASSFTRWLDGWIYGCHGFSNHSQVGDGSGKLVKMHSGNTYRFKADGSVFEQYTWGQHG